MTREEAIKVLENEWKCIDRNDGIHCDRDCGKCDLVMETELIRQAYNMAIEALSQSNETEMERIMNLEFQNWEMLEAGDIRIGDRISCLLAKKGMAQRDLAKACGITEVSISRYINNERVPRATVIIEIAKALNVSADTLLGLQSTQTEIIRCKDCRFASPNKIYGCILNRFSLSDKDERLYADDYCSRAERRTE